MESRVILGGQAPSNCFPEAPDFGGCEPCCEITCDPCCAVGHPAKSRARDVLWMKPREIEREFRFTEFGCRGVQVPMVAVRIGLVLRRLGWCKEIARLTPLRATLDGSVVFSWPKEFLASPAGQYEADLYLNNCEVGTARLCKPDCSVTITSPDAVQQDFNCAADNCKSCDEGDVPTRCCGCGSGCGRCSGDPIGEYAEVDEEPDNVMDDTDCGGCTQC